MTVEPNDRAGRVLVLSGPSSGGKSATAREFQKREPMPWLILDADVVLSAFPFSQVGDDLALVSRRLNRAFFTGVAGFAREGLDVICEQVFWGKDTYADALDCLAGLRIRLVEVTAGLEAAERREAERSGRSPGTSREQRTLLFDGADYDYVLDTTTKTPAQAAAELSGWLRMSLPPAS